MYERGERGTLRQLLGRLMRQFATVTRVEAGLSVASTGHRGRARQILPLMPHEHVRQVKIALVDRVVDRINVVEAVRVHVAAALAQQVHHGGMLRPDSEHQRRVPIVVLHLQLGPVVEQKLGQLRMTILYSIQHNLIPPSLLILQKNCFKLLDRRCEAGCSHALHACSRQHRY